MKSSSKRPATRRPVEVIVAVTRFREALSTKSRQGGKTEVVMKLASTDPRAFVKGDVLIIRCPNTSVRFALRGTGASRDRYYPLGISFLRENDPEGSDDYRLGFQTFPQAETQPDGTTITILDTYKESAAGARFKFSLFIQRGSDGALGIIDPSIEHIGDE
jgi:hypothetical protein